MKLRKYICNDCHNPFWVWDEMDHSDVKGCPYCYVEVEGVDNLKITITIPDPEKEGEDGI